MGSCQECGEGVIVRDKHGERCVDQERVGD